MPTDIAALKAKFNAKQLKVVNPEVQLCSLRLSSLGQLAAGSFTGTIRRWSWTAPNLEELPAIAGLNGWVQGVEFSSDGKTLFAVDSFGMLSAWDVAAKDAKSRWSAKNAHDGWIHALTLSPKGDMLATAGRDGTIRLASTTNGVSKVTLSMENPVQSLIFSPDGLFLIAGDSFGNIRQFDLVTNKPTRDLDAKIMYLRDRIQDVGGVRSFTFSKDGSLLIASGCKPKTGGFVEGRMVVLAFDWQTGKLKHKIEGTADTEGYVHQVRWHSDGFVIMASSGQPGNGKIAMQPLEETAPFWSQALPNVHSFAITSDDKFLFVLATNANSAGNGRNLGKDKAYPSNSSPIHIFELGVPETKKK